MEKSRRLHKPIKPIRRRIVPKKPEIRSRFAEFAEFATYMPIDGKIVTVKQVFDNLRCYPIVAVFLLALNQLTNDASTIGLVFAGLLTFCLLMTFFAVVVQTSIMVTMLLLEFLATFTPDEGVYVAPRDRRAFTWMFWICGTTIFLAILALVRALLPILQRIG